MSSIKDRQRAAARARLEKEMAERSAAAKKRRQRQTIIGSALAVVVIAGAAVWIVAALNKDDDKSKNSAAAPPPGTVACQWIPEDGSSGAKVKDVGTPPANVPNTGKDTLTMTTNLGAITATVDLSKAPCTGAAFNYLASKKFWDNSKCHRLTTEGIKVLQCGDPTASGKGYRQTDGTGGPSFRYAEENLPTNASPAYPKGTIAMAKTSSPSSTGSQFFIVYGDTDLPAEYTVLGTVTKGMDIVDSVAKAGTDNSNGQGDGHPKKEVDIKSLTVAAA
ncbi:peptidylprolyl isomerase [Actinoplanes sp. N902-109]|uniref:peptidylprolyl isomerase n=1 Tax=Actinoplanes sp. (strain N902-109) TaxID=649831 RepID=UPI00032940A5|nr:peptidylprolyl isomerase [Actinoplanes sp. N902-109]AGL19568.1 peptidyl-prolyl cis-trans isomerase cyclophilin type [Actinoplanes sp. N902-109]